MAGLEIVGERNFGTVTNFRAYFIQTQDL